MLKGVDINSGFFFVDFRFNQVFVYDRDKNTVTGAKLNLNDKSHILESVSPAFVLDSSLFVKQGIFFKHSLATQPVFQIVYKSRALLEPQNIQNHSQMSKLEVVVLEYSEISGTGRGAIKVTDTA